jgi:hypothetical protein
MVISLWILFRIRKVWDKTWKENENTHFVLIDIFPKIVPVRRCRGKIWYSQTGYRWQYNTAHALCMPDNQGYRHTLRICSTRTYRFCAATMVTQTRFNVTLYVHCLALCGTIACFHILPSSHFTDPPTVLSGWYINIAPCLFRHTGVGRYHAKRFPTWALEDCVWLTPQSCHLSPEE